MAFFPFVLFVDSKLAVEAVDFVPSHERNSFYGSRIRVVREVCGIEKREGIPDWGVVLGEERRLASWRPVRMLTRFSGSLRAGKQKGSPANRGAFVVTITTRGFRTSDAN
jgi:hypothetical protein